MRLVLFTGMVRGDALNYAHAAYELSEGRTHFGGWAGTARVGLYFPVAALYALFGPSEITTLALPFLSSLVSVVFVFLIARSYSNASGGLIAALLWAFLPLDVHLSTTLLPDVPVAAFSTAAIYFLLQAIRGENSRRNYLLTAGLIGFAILIKPIAIITLISALGVWLYAQRGTLLERWRRLWEGRSKRFVRSAQILFAVALLLGLILYFDAQPFPLVVTLANTADDLSGFFLAGVTELDVSGVRLFSSDLLVFITPLFVIAGVWALIKRARELDVLLVWLATLFLYYEWGTINTNPLLYVPIQGFNEARNLLFVLAPILVIAGVYLASFVDDEDASWLVPAIALTALGLAWLFRDQLLSGTVPNWLIALALVLPLLSVFSLRFLRNTSDAQRMAFGAVLLLVISLTSLKPSMPYHASWYADRQERLTMLKAALGYLENDGQVAINAPGNAMSLNYLSDFELGYDWAGAGVADARILTSRQDLEPTRFRIELQGVDTEPEGWRIVMTITGQLGNQLTLLERE